MHVSIHNLFVCFCLFVFSQGPDFKGEGCNHAEVLKPRRIFSACPKSGVSGLCMSCFVFNFSMFYVTWVYIWGSSSVVTVYNGVFEPDAACPVVWGFFRRSLKTDGLRLTFSFRRSCCLWNIPHTYSHYIPEFYYFCYVLVFVFLVFKCHYILFGTLKFVWRSSSSPVFTVRPCSWILM